MSETDIQTDLMEQLRNRSAEVAILGLGYVGLPLAVVFAEAGFHVVGIDLDQRKVDTIRRGESHRLVCWRRLLLPRAGVLSELRL